MQRADRTHRALVRLIPCTCARVPRRHPPQPAAKVSAMAPQAQAAFVAVLARTISGAGEAAAAAGCTAQGGLAAQHAAAWGACVCLCAKSLTRSAPPPHPSALPPAHPHTKLATLVYCESLCADPGLVGEMVNGDMGPALVRAAREGRECG